MFTDAEIKSYANDDALRLGLRRSEVDFIFWRRDRAGVLDQRHRLGRMLRLLRRPFREPYFGEGIGIAVRKGTICCGSR